MNGASQVLRAPENQLQNPRILSSAEHFLAGFAVVFVLAATQARSSLVVGG
jgi:hypothetical protein